MTHQRLLSLQKSSLRLVPLSMVLALVLALTVPLMGAEKGLTAAELKKELLGKSFTLPRAQNVAAKQYYKLGQKEFICRHKLTGLYPLSQDLRDVSITQIKEETESELLKRIHPTELKASVLPKEITKEFRYWVFTLKHSNLGKGEFRITTINGDLPDRMDEVLKVLGFVFVGDGLPRHKLLRAKTESKLVHFVGSGHAPDVGKYVEFDGIDEAANAGYQPCLLCFNRRLSLAYIDVEHQLGRETESTIRHYYQISKDNQMQARIERLGRKVLANWPSRLIGYDYQFNVIEDRDFNAVACPAGFILVHSGLVSLVESDQELEAILAHEIAHVEQRHGVKQLIRAKKNRDTAIILGALFGAAASAAVAAETRDQRAAAEIGESVADFGVLLYCVGAQIALQGYSRQHEMEADVHALNYFRKMGYPTHDLLTALRKIRTSVDLNNPRSANEADMFSSHPAPNNRIDLANSIEIEQWSPGAIFDGFNKEGELVFSVALHGACSYTQRDGTERCQIMLDVSTTDALAKGRSVDDLNLTLKNSNLRFTSDDAYELAPMDRIGMVFSRKEKRKLNPSDISTLKLGGIEAAKVVRRNVSN